jgi:hypothetical protein
MPDTFEAWTQLLAKALPFQLQRFAGNIFLRMSIAPNTRKRTDGCFKNRIGRIHFAGSVFGVSVLNGVQAGNCAQKSQFGLCEINSGILGRQ